MSTTHVPRVRIIGVGRAGGSFAAALEGCGWQVETESGRATRRETSQVDLVLVCVPDAAVGEVASSVPPDGNRVVAHCAGSVGLDVLEGHPRRGSIHPLVALPNVDLGASRLRGAWFALDGDPLLGAVVESLDGHAVTVHDEHRTLHHAAAVVASNHLVALMGQVRRIADSIGVPPEAYLDLAAGSLENVRTLGPADALTGPVRRGDWATVARHLEALPDDERAAYSALADAAARLVDDR